MFISEKSYPNCFVKSMQSLDRKKPKSFYFLVMPKTYWWMIKILETEQ